MKAELVPDNGDPPIPITQDVSVVGRREFCDVRINDDSLSKRHCVLVKTDGLLIIRDLASTNGTKVNGQRVRWAALLPKDRITMGRYKVKVYLGPDHAPAPSELMNSAAALPVSRLPEPVHAASPRPVGSGTRVTTAPGPGAGAAAAIPPPLFSAHEDGSVDAIVLEDEDDDLPEALIDDDDDPGFRLD